MFALLLAIVLSASSDWTFISSTVKGVVRVKLLSGEDAGTCSGAVFVSHPDYAFVVTAAHCTPGDKPQFTVNGRHAELVRKNEILDLAILKVELKNESVLPLAEKNPVLGEEIAVLGYGFGSRAAEPQMGHVSNPSDEDGWMHVSANILNGDSGGPVVNLKGEIVGIGVAVQFSGPSHRAIIVPLETVKDFLKPYLKTPKQ